MKSGTTFIPGFTLSASLILLAGCSSQMVSVAPTPHPDYQRLGLTEATACGNMGFLGTAYNFAPMRLNSRVDRAYKKAVANVPDATGLINVTLQESWYWWFIATTRCTTITGEAIK